jgi:hypothetical protein
MAAGECALTDMKSVLRKDLFPGEIDFFKKNRDTAGMATDDGRIIFNPYARAGINKDAVMRNELARLYMRGRLPLPPVRPAFDLTQDQIDNLPDVYKSAPIEDQRETIAARQYSGDPTGGRPTGDQKAFITAMAKALAGYK